MRKQHFDAGMPAGVHRQYLMARMIPRAVWVFVRLALLAALALPAWPQEKTEDLTNKSLEDLMNMEVTSVSKKEQKLSRTAAAIFVITQEDIRRSGATNIPDLLRMVPSMDVGEINGSTWAVSARGFNAQYSNKLLVMVDGRIVYTPNFAGVYWDTLDIPLPDIERIEVIRGPGGSVWGANAVNGVISIFTKKAADTRGVLIEAGAGNIQQGFGLAQYGGQLGKSTDYRVYTHYFDQTQMADINGNSGDDGYHILRSGFRTDTTLTTKDTLTFDGSFYSGREGELGYILPSVTSPNLIPMREQIDLGGGYLRSAWNHTYSDRSDSTLQFAFTRYTRDDPLEPETRDTIDLDYKHHFAWGKRQDIVWGLGYRYTTDRIDSSLTVSFNPPSKALQLFDAFVQDEIAVLPDRLYLTVGTKFEHNDYTGFEYMPSVRAAWIPNKHNMLWAAVSRALRAPSRNDTDLVVNLGSFTPPGGPLTLTRFLGNPDFHDERLIAYEAGYRNTISDKLSLDFAAYYNDYHSLQTSEPSVSFFENSPPPAHLVQTLMYENNMHGETHGVELAANWKAAPRLTISPGYALEQLHMHADPGSLDTITPLYIEKGAPEQSAQLRAHLDLSKGLELNAAAYFVEGLSHQSGTNDQLIPTYTRLDTGLTYRLREGLSVSAVGQNLQKDHHLEFEDNFGSMQSGQIKRSAYAKFTWQF
ncbi:MAG: TonB-dependent receptor [Candidatus Acidiferrales bacterium]